MIHEFNFLQFTVNMQFHSAFLNESSHRMVKTNYIISKISIELKSYVLFSIVRAIVFISRNRSIDILSLFKKNQCSHTNRCITNLEFSSPTRRVFSQIYQNQMIWYKSVSRCILDVFSWLGWTRTILYSHKLLESL